MRRLRSFCEGVGESTKRLRIRMPPVEVCLEVVSYRVPVRDDVAGAAGEGPRIFTLYNSTPIYALVKFVERLRAPREDRPKRRTSRKRDVLSHVNLVLKPGRMYLVLGPPLSGKTSLLRAVAGKLPQGDVPADCPDVPVGTRRLTGKISYNGLACAGDGADESRRTLFQNLVAFVRQGDAHAPRLTAGETLAFAGRCKDETRGRKDEKGASTEGKVDLILGGLGLGHVRGIPSSGTSRSAG